VIKMQFMEHQVYKRKSPVARFITSGIAVICLILLSCTKQVEPVTIPAWEDNNADSARLNITIKIPQGTFLTGKTVILALSRDSLSKNILVRSTLTNTAGIAVFRKLYPRKFYYSCTATSSTVIYFGTGTANLLSGMTKDTVLTVH